jgi:hypothetical protein
VVLLIDGANSQFEKSKSASAKMLQVLILNHGRLLLLCDSIKTNKEADLVGHVSLTLLHENSLPDSWGLWSPSYVSFPLTLFSISKKVEDLIGGLNHQPNCTPLTLLSLTAFLNLSQTRVLRTLYVVFFFFPVQSSFSKQIRFLKKKIDFFQYF